MHWKIAQLAGSPSAAQRASFPDAAHCADALYAGSRSCLRGLITRTRRSRSYRRIPRAGASAAALSVDSDIALRRSR